MVESSKMQVGIGGPSDGGGQECTGPFAVWEDTQLLDKDGDGGGTFAIHEDTQLLDKDGDGGGTFAVHEDTTLFGERKQEFGGQQTGDIVCYEDTELVGRLSGCGGAVPSDVLQPAALGSSPESSYACVRGAEDADDGLSFEVYEDTELL